MKPHFIVTPGDMISLGCLAILAIVFFGACLFEKVDAWLARRRVARDARRQARWP